jgi:hypothetical protein
MTAALGDTIFTVPSVGLPFRRRLTVNPKLVASGDRSLRRAVLARLIANPLVSAAHIRVTASGGRVTLSGYVTSSSQKEAASATACRVKGVEQVTDEIGVAVPCHTVVDPAPEQLEAQPPIGAPRPLGLSPRPLGA